jgi:DNA-directed RNA polymerase specialized sigma24 family protein
VVELRLAGLSGPEIALALGRSPGAVRLAQFRAYARLRDLLGPANASQE